MSFEVPPARPASGAAFAATLALALVVLPAPGRAATTLQHLLAVIDANPMLAFGGLYLNYSETLTFDPLLTTLHIDGSVLIAHHAAITPSDQATTPGTGPVTEPVIDPQPWMPLTIGTNVIGGNNSGLIKVNHSFHLASNPNQPEAGMTLPSHAIMAINATSTQAQVTGSVTMLSNAPPARVTEISTSAIGASNVGSISITLQNGAWQEDGG
jgi:hypothetical protein